MTDEETELEKQSKFYRIIRSACVSNREAQARADRAKRARSDVIETCIAAGATEETVKRARTFGM